MIKALSFPSKAGASVSQLERAKTLMTQLTDPKSGVLTANTAFYKALAAGDYRSMCSLWAVDCPVAVQHPGVGRVSGREDVMDTWDKILRAPPSITSVVEDIVRDDDQWAVICQEDLGRAVIRMVNVFQQEKNKWKLVYHGPAPYRRLSS